MSGLTFPNEGVLDVRGVWVEMLIDKMGFIAS